LARTGLIGLVMFLVGVFNMFAQVLLMLKLRRGGDSQLFAVVLSSSISTVVTSLPLALCILHEIARDSRQNFFKEVMERGIGLVLVVLLSTSRIESLSILRLRLGMCSPKPFPMKEKHFYFIQSIGAYHFFIKDVPHVLVSLALTQTDDFVPRQSGSIAGEVAECVQSDLRWLPEGLCHMYSILEANSPWIAVSFGIFNLVFMVLDGLIRAIAWQAEFRRTGGQNDRFNSRWVQNGLVHRVAEVYHSRMSSPAPNLVEQDHRGELTAPMLREGGGQPELGAPGLSRPASPQLPQLAGRPHQYGGRE
jgi:hypothetical protein